MYECWSDASIRRDYTILSYVVKFNDEIITKEIYRVDKIYDITLAEYMALCKLLKEIKLKKYNSVNIYTDNKAVTCDLKSSRNDKYRHVRKRIFSIIRNSNKRINITDIRWKNREFNLAHVI